MYVNHLYKFEDGTIQRCIRFHRTDKRHRKKTSSEACFDCAFLDPVYGIWTQDVLCDNPLHLWAWDPPEIVFEDVKNGKQRIKHELYAIKECSQVEALFYNWRYS